MSDSGLVTPFTGVWIEIIRAAIQNLRYDVTPFTGVWIEILGLV